MTKLKINRDIEITNTTEMKLRFEKGREKRKHKNLNKYGNNNSKRYRNSVLQKGA
jgi:hypothetical protein